MKPSFSYHCQKLTSLFMVVSFVIFTMSDVIFNSSIPFSFNFALFVPISTVACSIFIVSFGIYSYLRAVTLFGDYVKSANARLIYSNIILFVNLFTCTAGLIALLYIHFSSLISFA